MTILCRLLRLVPSILLFRRPLLLSLLLLLLLLPLPLLLLLLLVLPMVRRPHGLSGVASAPRDLTRMILTMNIMTLRISPIIISSNSSSIIIIIHKCLLLLLNNNNNNRQLCSHLRLCTSCNRPVLR
jgi:hypothetical protein